MNCEDHVHPHHTRDRTGGPDARDLRVGIDDVEESDRNDPGSQIADGHHYVPHRLLNASSTHADFQELLVSSIFMRSGEPL